MQPRVCTILAARPGALGRAVSETFGAANQVGSGHHVGCLCRCLIRKYFSGPVAPFPERTLVLRISWSYKVFFPNGAEPPALASSLSALSSFSTTMVLLPLEPNRRRSLSDPLSAVLQPPQNETPADRVRRLDAEFEAKRVSDSIDEMLKSEKKEKRMKPEVKILLLGQSESGKSTTLKRESLLPSSFRLVFSL